MVARAAQLFTANALWRATGLRSAGRSLVAALGSPDENVRTIAGMLLVKGGPRARPLLEEALQRRENLPMTLMVLADLGDPDLAKVIGPYADDPDPRVAQAARDALDSLRAIQEARTLFPGSLS